MHWAGACAFRVQILPNSVCNRHSPQSERVFTHNALGTEPPLQSTATWFLSLQKHVCAGAWWAISRQTVFNSIGRRLPLSYIRQPFIDRVLFDQQKWQCRRSGFKIPLKRQRRQPSDTDTRMLHACLSFLMCAQTLEPCIIRFCFLQDLFALYMAPTPQTFPAYCRCSYPELSSAVLPQGKKQSRSPQTVRTFKRPQRIKQQKTDKKQNTS